MIASISSPKAQSYGDNWTLLSSSEPGPTWNVGSHLSSFTVPSYVRYPFFCSALDNFTVNGGATNAPPWDNLYEALCNNTWAASEYGTMQLLQCVTFTYYHTYYTESGYETWLDTDTAGTATRNMNESITEYLAYITTPPSNGGGGGS